VDNCWECAEAPRQSKARKGRAGQGRAGKGGAQATQGNGQQSHLTSSVCARCVHVCASPVLRNQKPRRLSFFEFFHRRSKAKATSSSSTAGGTPHTHSGVIGRTDVRVHCPLLPPRPSSLPAPALASSGRPVPRSESEPNRSDRSLRHTHTHSNDKGRRQSDSTATPSVAGRHPLEHTSCSSQWLLVGWLLAVHVPVWLSDLRGQALKGVPRDRQA
jgi:hypothetical protein